MRSDFGWVSCEKDFFNLDFVHRSAEQAQAIIGTNPPNSIQENYEFIRYITDEKTQSGCLTLCPKNYAAAEALRSDAPDLFNLMEALEAIKTPHGRIIKQANKVPVINFSPAGGEVSVHVDMGDNTRRWLGRCATLQGTGLFQVLDKDSNDVIHSLTVRAGDAHTVFNPAKPSERKAHKVATIGNQDRISVGILVGLKNKGFSLI